MLPVLCHELVGGGVSRDFRDRDGQLQQKGEALVLRQDQQKEDGFPIHDPISLTQEL